MAAYRMKKFEIRAENLRWINGDEDDVDDLCLHGHAMAKIGDECFEYEATVSATALYLLKSLTEDHIIYQDNQMFPCCGHFIIPNDDLSNVEIAGCPNGIDWSVIHDGENVRLITDSGKETVVKLEDYRQEVYKFADMIEAYYMKCTPKNLPEDDYGWDRNSYTAFWNEWHRRRA